MHTSTPYIGDQMIGNTMTEVMRTSQMWDSESLLLQKYLRKEECRENFFYKYLTNAVTYSKRKDKNITYYLLIIWLSGVYKLHGLRQQILGLKPRGTASPVVGFDSRIKIGGNQRTESIYKLTSKRETSAAFGNIISLSLMNSVVQQNYQYNLILFKMEYRTISTDPLLGENAIPPHDQEGFLGTGLPNFQFELRMAPLLAFSSTHTRSKTSLLRKVIPYFYPSQRAISLSIVGNQGGGGTPTKQAQPSMPSNISGSIMWTQRQRQRMKPQRSREIEQDQKSHKWTSIRPYLSSQMRVQDSLFNWQNLFFHVTSVIDVTGTCKTVPGKMLLLHHQPLKGK